MANSLFNVFLCACSPSSLKFLFMSFFPFSNWVDYFSMLKFSILCIFLTGVLGQEGGLQYFSPPVVCLFILFRVFHTAKDLNFDEVQFTDFFFMDCVMSKHFTKPETLKILFSCKMLIILHFTFKFVTRLG